MKCFNNILLVTDGSLGNIKALKQAATLARECQAKLTLLSVIESLPASARMLITAVTPREIKDKLVRERLDKLETLAAMLGQDDINLQLEALYGNRSKETARVAAEGGHDLIIDVSEKGKTDRRLSRNCNYRAVFMKPEDCRTSERFRASLDILSAENTRHPVHKAGLQGGRQSFAQ